MDILLLGLGFLFMLGGLIGSVIPVMPGPIMGWIGLLLLHLTKPITQDWTFLGVTLTIALVVFAMDYIIPAVGTKKLGGTKAGMVGATLGVIIGVFTPIPGGIIIGPFCGALLGELTNNANVSQAIKAAFGALIGFLTGAFLKLIVACSYLGFFFKIVWENKTVLF